MSKTKYLKMKCPECGEIIDHVDEIAFEFGEGHWSPVTGEDVPKDRPHAYGSTSTVFAYYYIRCPKCKKFLHQVHCMDNIAKYCHRWVVKEE